jgi:phosphatidylserine/phosphatidylglycerophosphate/cardiolipin synthase-like enzyme
VASFGRSRRRQKTGALLLIVIAVAAALIATVHQTSSAPATRQASHWPTPRPTKTQAHARPTSSRPAKSATSASRPAGSVSGLSLFVEPDAGPAPVYALLRSARHTLDIEIYELEDDHAVAILSADARRGVRVRVLLNAHFVGRYNEPAYSYLRGRGVAVRWAPSQFDVTHEKAIVVDGRLAAIMTMNLTARYYSSSRDFVVVDRGRTDVAAVASTFAYDWANGGLPPASPADLVWSPGAQDALVALVASARHELLIENEEMSDQTVTSALQAAARRGVRVEVVMTRQREWAGAFDALAQAGVAVRTYAYSAPLYIHAKAIVVDPGSPRARTFVGSQNFSSASLLYNRELGLVTSRPAIVARVAAVIRADAAGATPWRP